MKISQYTTLAELTKSQTATRQGIPNEPNEAQIENLKKVCTEVFDKVREHFGIPIMITSGFRCEALNKAIGGAKGSQHCEGRALDIDGHILSGTPTNKQIFEHIKNNLEFDQLIWEFGNNDEPAWVHVSFVELKNRKDVLVGKKDDKGKTIYEKFA